MPDRTLQIKVGGTIDRMDSKEGVLRIIDYKTGGLAPRATGMEAVFTGKRRDHRIFQTFLYASVMCHKQAQKVSPGLLLIHRAASNNFSTDIVLNKENVSDFSMLDADFRERLNTLLYEIFDCSVPFKQTEHRPDICRWCDYHQLCKIKKNSYE